MTYQWSEFFDLAQGLYDDPDTPGPQEAAYRSSASRAYYAAYHLARLFAAIDGLTKSEPDHYDVINYFLNRGEPTRRKIGNQLKDAFTYRKWADYKDTIPQGKTALYLAQKTRRLATEIIAQLDALGSS